MSFDASTFISLLSLVVAVATALAAHHYFRRAEYQRDEDLIKTTLATLIRCRAEAATFKRERSKTGCPINEGEKAIFEKIDLLAAIVNDLEKDLLEFFSSGKKLTSEIRSAALRIVAMAESFSIDLQVTSARFQNFNNNKVGKLLELQAKLPELEFLLRQHSRKP